MLCLSTEQIQPGKRQCNVPMCLNPDLEGQPLRMRGEWSHRLSGCEKLYLSITESPSGCGNLVWQLCGVAPTFAQTPPGSGNAWRLWTWPTRSSSSERLSNPRDHAKQVYSPSVVTWCLFLSLSWNTHSWVLRYPSRYVSVFTSPWICFSGHGPASLCSRQNAKVPDEWPQRFFSASEMAQSALLTVLLLGASGEWVCAKFIRTCIFKIRLIASYSLLLFFFYSESRLTYHS